MTLAKKQFMCDGSITNMWSVNGFIKDLPLPCRQVKQNSFVQVIRMRPVHSP